MKLYLFKIPKLAIIVCCIALLACESKQDTATSRMKQYGCLPELAVHNSIDSKLAEAGILRWFLKNNTGYHISTLSDISGHGEIFRWCIQNQQELEYQRKFKEDYFKPLITADTNRDGKPDLVAIFVNKGKFNLIIFNAVEKGRFSKPYWLLRDEKEIILGADVTKEGLIIPHFCIGCDSNPLFRWVDSDYEFNGHTPGDQVCVEENTTAYLTPDTNSKTIWNVNNNQIVSIVRVGPKDDALSANKQGVRWYQIKSNEDSTSMGYVQSNRFLEEPGYCDSNSGSSDKLPT